MSTFGELLSDAEIDLFEAQVAPRYVASFGAPLMEALLPGDQARVVHLGCCSGFHDGELAERAGAIELVGVDTSPWAVARARSRAPGNFSYLKAAPSGALPLADASFSHAVSLYSLGLSGADAAMRVEESRRLLRPGGQLLLLMPLRGSFQELLDLLREQALATESSELSGAIEALAAGRPSVEQTTESLESAGFDDVDVALRRLSLDYECGAQFLEDPSVQVLIEPPLRRALPPSQADAVLAALRVAIDRYWSDLPFELTLNLGCISARR